MVLLSVIWLGQQYETSVAVALLGILLAAIAFTTCGAMAGSSSCRPLNVVPAP